MVGVELSQLGKKKEKCCRKDIKSCLLKLKYYLPVFNIATDMGNYCSYDPKWSTVGNQLNYPSLAEPQKWLNISLKKLNHRNTVGVVFSILYFHHILVRSVPLQYLEQQEVQ